MTKKEFPEITIEFTFREYFPKIRSCSRLCTTARPSSNCGSTVDRGSEQTLKTRTATSCVFDVNPLLRLSHPFSKNESNKCDACCFFTTDGGGMIHSSMFYQPPHLRGVSLCVLVVVCRLLPGRFRNLLILFTPSLRNRKVGTFSIKRDVNDNILCQCIVFKKALDQNE